MAAHRDSTELDSYCVFIYESEYHQIQAWTAMFPHLETGGDLFGLWLDENTAVVQLVLGPGKGCHRTGASFYQDVEYLERVGNQLTTKEGLCHIGEWHSHHTLGLTRPSGGDENTVWTNMRRYGIHRFFLFIANISKPLRQENVEIGCFFFETYSPSYSTYDNEVTKGRFKLLKGTQSPFRQKMRKELIDGAEPPSTGHMLQQHEENQHSERRSSKKKRGKNRQEPRRNNQNKPQCITAQEHKPSLPKGKKSLIDNKNHCVTNTVSEKVSDKKNRVSMEINLSKEYVRHIGKR